MTLPVCSLLPSSFSSFNKASKLHMLPSSRGTYPLTLLGSLDQRPLHLLHILSVGCRHFNILSIGHGCKTSILVAFWNHVLGRKPFKNSNDRRTLSSTSSFACSSPSLSDPRLRYQENISLPPVLFFLACLSLLPPSMPDASSATTAFNLSLLLHTRM